MRRASDPDPGPTEVYGDLLSSQGHGSTSSLRLPVGHSFRTFGDCQVCSGDAFGATVLALRGPDGLTVSPAWDTPVPAGTTLYHVGRRRIAGRELAQRG